MNLELDERTSKEIIEKLGRIDGVDKFLREETLEDHSEFKEIINVKFSSAQICGHCLYIEHLKSTYMEKKLIRRIIVLVQ